MKMDMEESDRAVEEYHQCVKREEELRWKLQMQVLTRGKEREGSMAIWRRFRFGAAGP